MSSLPDKQFDAGDKDQVSAKKNRAKALEERVNNGLHQILSQPDSRLWLYLQLEEAGPFNDPFTGNSQTFYNCGQQVWAKRMIATLLDKHLPEYVKMMTENKGTTNG